MSLFEDCIDYNAVYYTKNLITYLGNKRALLPFLNSGIQNVKKRLGKNKIIALDGFAGSGVVSRLLKHHSHILYVNDIERYSYILNKCYLANKGDVDLEEIKQQIDRMNSLQVSELLEGFITKNYAPQDDDNIKENERVFYTHENAMRIDTIKKYIFENYHQNCQQFYLAPLLVQASIHTNTSGVFKGFHKKNGIGHFGGKNENCLERIKGKIKLEYPILSENECEVHISQMDINTFIKKTLKEECDLVYYDPPYNQHPYGSNYFMLNIIANSGEDFKIQNGVSGISAEWYKSPYNKKDSAITALDDLIHYTNSKFILMSYNNEGIIPFNIFKDTLGRYGKVSLLEQDYHTYRGCRNLKNRSNKVKELLWILEKR